MHYTITRESTKTTTRVHADDPATAALRGAIKLGVRHFGKKPTMVVDLHGRGDYYQPYCYVKKMNASSNCYDPVIVSKDN